MVHHRPPAQLALPVKQDVQRYVCSRRNGSLSRNVVFAFKTI
jgi:hypothetical protein